MPYEAITGGFVYNLVANAYKGLDIKIRHKGGYYDYYCCNHDHKHLNIRAERANDIFVQYIAGLVPNEAVSALYKEIIADARGNLRQARKGEIGKLDGEILKVKERLNRVNDLYFDGEMDEDDYVSRFGNMEIPYNITRISETDFANLKQLGEYTKGIVSGLLSPATIIIDNLMALSLENLTGKAVNEFFRDLKKIQRGSEHTITFVVVDHLGKTPDKETIGLMMDRHPNLIYRKAKMLGIQLMSKLRGRKPKENSEQ